MSVDEDKINYENMAKFVHEQLGHKTHFQAGKTGEFRQPSLLERCKTFDKAARLVAHEHPFWDGNKRVAFVICEMGRRLRILDDLERSGLEVTRPNNFTLIDNVIDDHLPWLMILEKI